MEFDGRVTTSQTSIPNRTDGIARRFFFTHDIAKSVRSNWLNGCEFMTTIHIQTFHLRPWLKMKSQIQWPRPNLPLNTHVLRRCKAFRIFQEIEMFRHLNPWIYCFPLLLAQFLGPRSVWKWGSWREYGEFASWMPTIAFEIAKWKTSDPVINSIILSTISG